MMEILTDSVVELRPAEQRDCGDVAVLLKSAGLPITDIDSTLAGFQVAHHDDNIVGVVGIEVFGADGLLRSLVVKREYRQQKIGSRLFDEALDFARKSHAQALYLLTTDAADYFSRRGFTEINREDAPQVIQTHEQYTSLCPSSATVMRRSL